MNRLMITPSMFFIIIGAGLLLVFVLYIAEVACIQYATAHRPSTVLRVVAGNLYDALHAVGYVIGLLFDIFGFLRRMCVELGAMLFRWIPPAVFKQAWDDLKNGLGKLAGALLAPIWGIYDSLSAATVPVLSAVLFLVALPTGVLVWEVVADIRGWTYWRPGVYLPWVAASRVQHFLRGHGKPASANGSLGRSCSHCALLLRLDPPRNNHGCLRASKRPDCRHIHRGMGGWP